MKYLVELCRHSSPSRQEHEFVEWLVDYIIENFPGVIVETDKYDNIYVTKGEAETYSCIVAHSDMVEKNKPTFTVCQVGDCLFGYDDVEKTPVGLGFDDKTGICVALHMLEKYPTVKAAFFTGEEIGCLGSGKADITFFDNCRFVVQCDRKGNSDFITTAAGTELCSKDFIKAVNPEAYGYKEATGLITDVKELKHRNLKVSACNISCGYYNPHSEKECQSISDLEKCIKLVDHIFTDLTDVYPHEKKTPSYSYPSNSGRQYGAYKGGKSYYTDDDYDDYSDYYGTLYGYTKPVPKKNVVGFTDAQIEEIAKEYIKTSQYPSEYGFIYDCGGYDLDTDFRENLRKIYQKIYNETHNS